MVSAEELTIRPGGEKDVPAVLNLLDEAVRWLVSQGRPGQWGIEPLSTDPRHAERLSGQARAGGLHLACQEERPVGALMVGVAPGHLPVAPEPELFVNLLVTDPGHAGRGIGGRLLEHARGLARAGGVELLRVDCYAGDDQALIRYYEREGFRRASTFEVKKADGHTWPGQLLEQQVPPTDESPGRATE